jgi:DNA-directed RNA polymerase I, II, and III subunit RPABC1
MSQDNDRELARLWRVSKTVHEMIRDRVRLALLPRSLS